MSPTLHARWHVTPLSLPQVERHCSHCCGPRPFRCSGKVRLNANGRRLDAWLIYKCATCDQTWTLPLLDRVPVAEVPHADLAAMQTSDPTWVKTRAFDLAVLRRHAGQVLLPTDLAVTKRLLDPGAAVFSAITLAISAPWPTGQRLDRLLCAELGLSRSALQALQGAGALRILQGSRHALRAPLSGSVVLHVDLGRVSDRTRADLARLRPAPARPRGLTSAAPGASCNGPKQEGFSFPIDPAKRSPVGA